MRRPSLFQIFPPFLDTLSKTKGSCWAFGSTENIESHVALATNATTAPVLSPQNLVSCDPNPKHCGGKGGCRGSIPELAFDWVKAHGLASEEDYPYVSGHTSLDEPCNTTVKPAAHILGYTKLKSNNYTEVMYALATRGPVAVNVDAIPMQSYGGGLMTACAIDKTHIDHVVQLVGYGYDADADLNYWWLRNSWGTTWGIDGYMKLQRHDPKENWCSIDIYPADGTGCDGGPGTVNTCGSCGVLYDVSYPIGGSMA
jgi:cathepsin L